jgi:hypothetical protein
LRNNFIAGGKSMNLHNETSMVTLIESDDVKTSNSVQSNANSNSNEESRGVKTSNLHITNISYNWDEYFQTVFDEAFNRLLHSKSLSDIEKAFKYAAKEIGSKEFVTAILLLKIYEIVKEDKKYLPNRGYDSLSDFIKDLKGCGINNRTSFYNYIKTGQILLTPTLFSFRTKITNAEIFENFSKIKYLSILKKNRNKSIPVSPDDIMEHFHQDTCREFKNYINDLQIKIDELNSRYTKKVSTKPKKSVKDKTENETSQIMQLMDDKFKEIYREIHMGHFVIFAPNINQKFSEDARSCAEIRVKKWRDKLNRDIENSRFFMSKKNFLESLKEIENTFVGTMINSAFFEGPILNSSPNTIKHLIRDNFKAKTDCELAEAFLINRLHSEPELKKYLAYYNVTKIKDFAYNILDIGESQYKRLKKIGANLKFVENFQGEINLMAPGFLEKLYFLDRAIKNHKNDRPLITRYLNRLSAKQFREFARDPSYRPDNEPINRPDYNTALSLYQEYESMLKKHESVAIIGLPSQRHVESFKKIITAFDKGKEYFERWYPEIPWPYLDEHESEIA